MRWQVVPCTRNHPRPRWISLMMTSAHPSTDGWIWWGRGSPSYFPPSAFIRRCAKQIR